MIRKTFLQFAAVLIASSMRLSAGLVNGSFETGDFTGWTVRIPLVTNITIFHLTGHVLESNVMTAGAVGIYNALADSTHGALEGSKAAYIYGGNALYTLFDSFTPGSVYHTTLSQTLSLNTGDKISGWSWFYNGDFLVQDSAYVKIFGDSGAELAAPWMQYSGPTYTNRGTSTPWTYWEWTVPVDGSYTLTLGGTTRGDGDLESSGHFDNIQVTAAAQVPEPSSTVLSLGLTSLLYVLRPNRKNEIKSPHLLLR